MGAKLAGASCERLNQVLSGLGWGGGESEGVGPDAAPRGSPAQMRRQHRLCLLRLRSFGEVDATYGNEEVALTTARLPAILFARGVRVMNATNVV
jgi:hypothetical protein